MSRKAKGQIYRIIRDLKMGEIVTDHSDEPGFNNDCSNLPDCSKEVKIGGISLHILTGVDREFGQTTFFACKKDVGMKKLRAVLKRAELLDALDIDDDNWNSCHKDDTRDYFIFPMVASKIVKLIPMSLI